MSCCDVAAAEEMLKSESEISSQPPTELFHADLLVPDIHCAGCIQRIEKQLHSLPWVVKARVNLSTKRVSVDWQDKNLSSEDIANEIEKLGFIVQPLSTDIAENSKTDKQGGELLRALAVAGFASANIMLLSVSVWSGASDATKALFHWISALIALPTIIYAGQPFFRSAWSAVKNYQLNMDVPISLAVLLAGAMSLFQTFIKGDETYFDAAVMLLFFLLIGRYLDYMMREKARSAIAHLLSLRANGANVLQDNGQVVFQPLHMVEKGMHVIVAAGERIPIDGRIIKGCSDIDFSVITGESAPEAVKAGHMTYAGALNLTGPLEIEITSIGEQTLLSDMIRLMEAAEQSKAQYVRLSNKAASIYAPVVHLLALICFIGWMFYTQGDWHTSLLTAISVLIITCPCALGLAVPVVQIVASGVLFRNGVMVKDGAALEKLAQVDTILFDKTGTLTLGKPRLISAKLISGEDMSDAIFALAAGLAGQSHHPLSKALSLAVCKREITPQSFENISEVPGSGMQGRYQDKTIRLGHRLWCGLPEKDISENNIADTENSGFLELCLQVNGEPTAIFYFDDEIRPEAYETIQSLKADGFNIGMISGDHSPAVRRVADQLNIKTWFARMKPQDKVEYLKSVAKDKGQKVFMVGDGLNDAPALAAGFTSMAPSNASDVGRTAADFVFLGDSLQPIAYTREIAKLSHRLILQNFALALIYNLIAIPIAVFGYASPLVAAIAMSSSSLVVILNALRLQLRDNKTKKEFDHESIHNMIRVKA